MQLCGQVPQRRSSLSSYLPDLVRALLTLQFIPPTRSTGIKDFLEDLNAQLLVTIQGEFDKVEGTPAPEPSRTSADVAALAPVTGGGAAKGLDPLDDLFPRVEIDGLLKGTTILADSKSDAWKTRKEALETLQALLDQGANKRLKPSIGKFILMKVNGTDIQAFSRRDRTGPEGQSAGH
jgi:cytoskeleton-associated protein 5